MTGEDILERCNGEAKNHHYAAKYQSLRLGAIPSSGNEVSRTTDNECRYESRHADLILITYQQDRNRAQHGYECGTCQLGDTHANVAVRHLPTTKDPRCQPEREPMSRGQPNRCSPDQLDEFYAVDPAAMAITRSLAT